MTPTKSACSCKFPAGTIGKIKLCTYTTLDEIGQYIETNCMGDI